MKKHKDTLIFDLDGTLLDTLDDLHLSFNYTLKNFGYKTRTIQEIRAFVGNGVQKAIEKALPPNIDNAELQSMVGYFKKYYKENMYINTKPYGGIIDMLQILKQKEYKLAVVSNKYDTAVKSLAEKYFGNYIDTAVGESEIIRRKPEADGINKAVSELKSDIKNTIYIGDSEVDIQTAKNAGIPCISVLWGFKDKEFLIQHGAEYFADKPKDIIKIIETSFI